MRITAALLAASVSLIPLTAVAAESTQDGAATLARTLQAYFGPSVTAVPAGDAYTVTFDPQPILAPLAASGVTVTAKPFAFTAAPQDDGKWAIKFSGDYAAHISAKGFETDYKATGADGALLFDPVLGAFSSGKASFGSLTSETSAAGGGQPDTRSASATNGERTDFAAAAGSEPHSVDTLISRKSGATYRRVQGGGFPVSIDIASSAASLAITGGMNRPLLDVWAWLMAHPTRDSAAAAQEELRPLLSRALPVFQKALAQAGAKDLKLVVPNGVFDVDTMSFKLELPGLVDDASLSEDFSFDGLADKMNDARDWTMRIWPVSGRLAFSASGFDLAKASASAMLDFDLKKNPAIPPDTFRRSGSSLLADGSVHLKLSDFSLASKDYRITASGTGALRPMGPQEANILVTASGFDKVQDILAAAGDDPDAKQVFSWIDRVRSMAKVGGDGTLAWALAFANNQLTVNGQPVK